MSPYLNAADCADSLTNSGVAWMWSDELTDGYSEKRVAARFFKEPRHPVILRGSREVMYRENARYHCSAFVRRAARMLRFTDGDDKLMNAILGRARDLFPRVRDVDLMLMGAWGAGKRINVDESAPTADLYIREHLLRNIRREMVKIAQLERPCQR